MQQNNQIKAFDFDFTTVNLSTITEFQNSIFTDVKNIFDQVVAVDNSTRNFENSVRPLIEITAMIEVRINAICYAENFYSDEAIRNAATEASSKVSEFMIEQRQRKDLYQAFQSYQQGAYQTEKANLTFEENKYVEKSIRDFKREGLHLDDAEFISMKKEISELCIKANANINADKTSFEFTRQELDGLPESWFTKERLVKEGESKNLDIFKVTLKYPDYYPFMEYVKNSELRKKLTAAYNSRATENVPLIQKMFTLRNLVAKKLGYKTHADYKCEVQIIKSGQNALDFLNGLNQQFQPLYEQDEKDVTAFAKVYAKNPLNKDKLEPWDLAFYKRVYKEDKCNIDLEQVKQYFPLKKVQEGLFHIYQNLLGLIFEEVETTNKWHQDVKLFCVKDAKSQDIIGYFYFDLFPREGKYSHAACFDFQTTCDTTKFQNERLRSFERLSNVCCIACNFEPNGCISFSDVETFFHEFGHVMHYICGKTQLQEFSSFQVENDFIEAPSQMLEFWCYEKEPLQLMSAHETTGEPISEEIIEKLRQMEKQLQGMFNKRQIFYGLFDLKVHTTQFSDANDQIDTQLTWYKTEREVLHYDNNDPQNPACGFAHIFGGYDAGYYGYLRAESYAANMFYKVFKNGKTLDPESGMRYRTKILQPGSTKDGLQLVEDFIGEKTDDKYFAISKGLASE